MVLKDFECTKCGVSEKLVQSSDRTIVCCGTTATAIISAPHLKGVDSFNAHYDLQLGQWFGSQKEKQSFLVKTGREQTSGFDSPRESNNTSIKCTKEQARKFDAVENTGRTIDKSKRQPVS